MPLPTTISRYFASWGALIHDYRWAVIVVWIVAAVVLDFVAPEWSSVARDGDLEQLPADTTLIRGEQLSRQAFPADKSRSQLVLVFARQDAPLTIEDREFAIRLGNEIAESEVLDVVDVWNEKSPVVGESLRSPTGQAQRVVIRLKNEFMATENIRVLAEVERILAAEKPDAPSGLEIGVSGSAAVGGDMLAAAAESVESTHTTTILLVAAALMLIYRSPLLVVIPLLTIALAASVSIDLLALLADFTAKHPHLPSVRVFTTTKIFVIVLLFGAGTDFCLFLTARFREHRRLGEDLRKALMAALGGVGGPLVASACTTIMGLAMMAFAEFGKFAYSGPSIAISLAITLLACLTLAPALLATRIGLLINPKTNEDAFWHRMWEGIADAVLARPGAILAVSLLIALPFAWHGWNANVTYDLLGELPRQRPSRRGTEMLRQYFPPGEIGPLVVLAESDRGNLDSLDGQLKIAELAKPLDDLKGVAQVRSLYQPLGDPPGSVSIFSGGGIMALAAKESPLTKAVFVSDVGEFAGKVTRLFLILTDQPFSREAVATLTEVEAVLKMVQGDSESPWQGAKFALAGPTVGIRDLEIVTLADRFRIEVLVVLAVFVVILVLLRSPLVAGYLMLSVVLSYAVTMGITSLVFQTIYGEAYAGLDWKVPLFLFVLLVAVGQDYNIYLVTRVSEEQRLHGSHEGLRRALVETGGIITSCGVIMAGTFVSMTTGELNGIVELGFALTLGILLDTFVVRTILVPAFLALVPRNSSESHRPAEK
jgi:putative drug exporter of the RND superfamily